MMLTQRQAEKFCHLPARQLDTFQRKGLLPFTRGRQTRYSRRSLNCWEMAALQLQKELASAWDLTLAEGAWVVLQITNGVYENWNLATTDGWIVRRKQPGTNVYAVWLTDRHGVRDFLADDADEGGSFEWSPAALDVLQKMRADGASDAEIMKTLLAIEGDKLAAWQREQPRTIWVYYLSTVFALMEEAARETGFPLPPRSDRAAWFGVSGK